MKLKNIIFAGVVAGSLFSCYKDLGNYDYKEINELTIEGINARYAVDSDDSLNIYPKLSGTQYADTSKFSYEWEIDRRIVAETHDLNIVVEMLPGDKASRFIVKDKETGVKKYQRFNLNVSSSTAGDLIVVLSKYKGKAEVSHLRLDKPSNFAVNYYEGRFGKPLGSDPKQLHIRLCESSYGLGFSNVFGRVMALVDDEIKLINKLNMTPDTVYHVLSGDSYIGNASYPKPDVEGYQSQYIVQEGISMWRSGAYGLQLQTQFNEISGGALYFAQHANRTTWAPSYSYKNFSPYNKGGLSPFAFFDDMSETPHGGLRQAGFSLGNLIVFDPTAGRFAYASSGVSREIKLDQLPAYPGYKLVWGSATVMADNTSLAILANGDNYKLLLITRKKDATLNQDVYAVAAEVNCNNTVLNSSSKFYVMNKATYLFFTTGDKLYKYNLVNMQNSVVPTENDVIAKLSDYGYDNSAVITDLCVSRTEATLLLGVSRYGEDAEAMGDEPKGDILGFDLKNYGIIHNPIRTFKGIAGIPVDIEIKYQTHRRFGLDFNDILIDNI